jgi:hypothetical protein
MIISSANRTRTRYARARAALTKQLGSQKAASELMANIQDHIPLESETTKSPTPISASGQEVKKGEEKVKPAWL